MPMDEQLLGLSLPHSPEAEQAVLGSMLIDADCIKDVMEKLRPDDFFLRQNREVFETLQSMFLYSRPIDALTVVGEMEKNGTYDDATTRGYLAELMEVTPTSANVPMTPSAVTPFLFFLGLRGAACSWRGAVCSCRGATCSRREAVASCRGALWVRPAAGDASRRGRLMASTC